MKKLLLIWIFSGSLDGICQSVPVEKMKPNTGQYIKGKNGDGDTLRYNVQLTAKDSVPFSMIDISNLPIYVPSMTFAQTNEVKDLDRLMYYNSGWIKPDTVRASLLITSGHMTMARCYEGYAVRRGIEIIGYLDVDKQPFKAPFRVWGYMVKD